MNDQDTDDWATAGRERARRRVKRSGVTQVEETPASEGRTVYPRGADPGRQAFVEQRERRRFAERLTDTRLAYQLPNGRAEHLVRRFPPLQGAAGLELYAGEGRQALLSALYQAVIRRAPELVPTPADLAEAAELGEESVIDLLLAEVDRDVRLMLDEPPERLWALLGLQVEGAPVAGVRQILDALLTIADDGHAPGTRVRMLTGPVAGRVATVTRVVWSSSGPPVAYRTMDELGGGEFGAATGDLAVLAGQECLGR